MARVCQVTGKRPVTGNNVSHAKNRTRRRFLPNLHHHRFWVESEKRFVSLRVSSKGMRIIDKNGIEQVLGEICQRIEDGGWLVGGGLVYLESPASAGAPDLPQGWTLLRSKRAGEVGYHLARRDTADRT